MSIQNDGPVHMVVSKTKPPGSLLDAGMDIFLLNHDQSSTTFENVVRSLPDFTISLENWKSPGSAQKFMPLK